MSEVTPKSCSHGEMDSRIGGDLVGGIPGLSLEARYDGPRSVRVDAFLVGMAADKGISRERVKKAITEGRCRINGETVAEPSRRLRQGQHVSCIIPALSTSLAPSVGPVEVLYEDADLAVVIKPAGLTVHPCPSCAEETFVQRLLHRFPGLALLGGERPGIVHRLDKDTSGLMLVALSERAHHALVSDFSLRRISKIYLALVRGILPSEGRCDAFIGRHPTLKTKMASSPVSRNGFRPALSEFRRLYADEDGIFSLAAVCLHTGRTHQIRVHMADMGHPLLGDATYGVSTCISRRDGSRFLDPSPRQMLHAWRLAFKHPFTGREMRFTAPLPVDFVLTARSLLRRMTRFVLTGLPGSGKSTVAEWFSKRMPVWSADAVVAALYGPGGSVISELERRYPSRFVTGGVLDRKSLFEAMRDVVFRRELEAIVHPIVADDLSSFFTCCEEGGEACAAAEIPLWFESDTIRTILGDAPSPFVVGVSCQRQVRHGRLHAIRAWDEGKIAVMDSWQWEESRKLGACDAIVSNDGSQTRLQMELEHSLPIWTRMAERRCESQIESLLNLPATLDFQ